MSGNTPKQPKQPKYSEHSSGQARVVIGRRVGDRVVQSVIYLGKHGSPESFQEYERVIAEWRATGSCTMPAANELTVDELFLRYWDHVQEHYQKNGRPTSEQDLIRRALRCARELYGATAAARFGPLALKAVRARMLKTGKKGWNRKNVNKAVRRVIRAFKWGTQEELIPPSVYHGLDAIEGLSRGRTKARESVPVRPVPEGMLAATLQLVSTNVRAMIELQLYTGMRPGEVCIMRGCDLVTSGRVWIYRPDTHKTEHQGKDREIYLGPRAQAALKPFLQPNLQAYLFSPAAAEAARQAARRLARKTPLFASHVRQLEKKRKPQRGRAPRERYDVCSYRHAIDWACQKAFPLPEHLGPRIDANGRRETAKAWRSRLTPEEKYAILAWRQNHAWHPNQLRHNAGTNLRKEFGIELSRIILGHSTAFTTEIYAEADRQQAMEVIGKIG